MGRYFRAKLDSILFQIFIDENKLTITRANGKHAQMAVNILFEHMLRELPKHYPGLVEKEHISEDHKNHNSTHPCQDPLREAEHIHLAFNKKIPAGFENFLNDRAKELEKDPDLRNTMHQAALARQNKLAKQALPPTPFSLLMNNVYDYLSPPQINIPFDATGSFNFINPDEPFDMHKVSPHYDGCFPTAAQELTFAHSNNISQLESHRRNHNFKEEVVGPVAATAVAILCCSFWCNKIKNITKEMSQLNKEFASKKMD